MISVSNRDILKNTDAYLKYYNAVENVAFTEEDFLRKALPKLSSQVDRQYPYQVNIPPSLHEMIQGNFEPVKTITIEKPIEGPFGEMWFGDSISGARLLAGYRNGDSRYICDYSLGDENVHGILVGSTGQGKSVTLNAFIFGLCYLYAPWEVDLTLCDAKIVEFKTIAESFPMPQIRSVAATEDADYLISVLDEKRKEMMLRNQMFTAAGNHFHKKIAKIADFREATGLALPQVVIVIDEFQTMFKGAKKKAGKIAEILDKFARLGRSTGVHFLMASQEVGSDLDAGIMANIKLRMAMGCYKSVSEKVLGNDGAAANMGKRGHMLLNDNIEGEGGAANNVLFRVPFPTPKQIQTIADAAIQKGKEFDVTPVLSFYDEQALVSISQYDDFLKQFNVNPNRIYLGEPSCVLNDPEQCVKLEFTAKSLETIGVWAKLDMDLIRVITMFMKNLQASGVTSNVIECSHPVIEDEMNLKQYALNGMYFNKTQYEDNPFFSVVYETIYKRLLMVEVDKLIFSGNSARNADTDRYFDAVCGKGTEMDTVLNRERFPACQALLESNKQINSGLGLASLRGAQFDAEERRLMKSCISLYSSYGFADKQIDGSRMPIIYAWLIGMDSIIGLGRANKSKFVTELATAMMSASIVNVRILTFTTSYTDLREIAEATRWFIFDKLTDTDASKVKCNCFPDSVSSCLTTLYDSTNQDDGCIKFKRMVFDGEILG